MLINDLHPLKAFSSIDVTDGGIDIFLIFVHLVKHFDLIAFIFFGNKSFKISSLSLSAAIFQN